MTRSLIALGLLVACGGESRLSPSIEGTGDTDGSGPIEPIDLRLVELGLDLLPDALPGARRQPVAVDWDRDGDADLVELTDVDVSLVSNDDGVFATPVRVIAASGAAGLLTLDVDGDGAREVLLLGGEAPDALILQDGALWTAQVLDGSSRAGVTGDIDGDGADDALTWSAEGPRWWRAQDGVLVADQPRGLPAEPPTGGLALADLDGDGHTDLVLGGSQPQILLGDGQGAFTRIAGQSLRLEPGPGRVVLAVDLDADGDTDLVFAGDGPARLARNEGGVFHDATAVAFPTASGSAIGAAAADLDQDGYLDLVLAHRDHPLSVWRADGQGRYFDYSDAASRGPDADGATGLVVHDLDADGDPDVYVTRDDLRRPRLWVHWHPEPAPDADGDGIPDEVDVCPDTWDPAQADRDFEPFACEGRAGCAERTGCTLLWLDASPALRCPDGRTQASAVAACAALGARLVLPTSDAHTQALLDAGVTGWLDLSDREQEGDFVRDDGSAPDFTPWAEGEPNDAGGAEDCVQLRSDGQWNDLPCDRSLPYTCVLDAPYASRDPGDACDVCPGILDDQADTDGDGVGDACDAD